MPTVLHACTCTHSLLLWKPVAPPMYFQPIVILHNNNITHDIIIIYIIIIIILCYSTDGAFVVTVMFM